ncbi:Plexin-C1 [Merluccius polli]|uniref:Plexin-C1 n=1 Tax=Merluccius polli TaxID=89951 RepID=A0AA47M232_MERPO|nr:Plexin-C1 [Merluccius polli]
MGPLASWLPLLLVALGGFRWARALQEPTDSFTARVGDVRGFAVAAPWVYVDTGDHLHQLDLSLVSLRSLHQRGTYVAVPESFDRTLAGLHAFGVKIMAPIVDRNVLITCGAVVCGYCELLDLRNITRIIHREFTEDASVGFLVDINNKSYLLTAAEFSDTDVGVCPYKPTHPRIRLYGTNFVDGFQIKSTIFIFSNVNVTTDHPKVRLIWLGAKETKSKTLQSLRGAILDCSEGGEARQRLVSSSVIPGVQPVLWTGIFSEHGTTNTKLAIFDISPPTNEQTYNDPDFSTTPTVVNERDEPSTLKPKRVLLKHRFMTSVLAVKMNKWLVVFVGTGDGQLLKLIVDNNLQAHCLTVIWKAVDEHPVFPEMHLDPVGRKHVLVAVKNQLTRVPVSQCGQHSSSLGTCWSAHDPYCGWCDSRKRCSFEDECPASLWLSVPDDLSQRRMLSHSFQEDKDGKIKLVVHTHLTTGESGPPANFSCHFVSSVGELEGLQHQYPQCTCLLPPVIDLHVNVTVSLEGVVVTEELKLVNCTGIIGAPKSLLCSQCLAAGCGWSHDACTWTHMGTLNMTVCQALQSEVDSLPEIFNITQSALSLYGKNNVLLTGRNLDHVTRVRIQGDMDCSPKEASVWSNTGHSLMLHIPAGDKGRVQVCLLMHDGRCHGNASLTYHSVPICTSIVPNSSWASGKRKMEITVSSNVEFVEEVTHSHTDQKVAFSRSSNGVTLRYESLAVEQSQGSFSSSVTLRVANHTLACPTAIHYLPEPKFTTFTSTRTTKHQLLLTIQKRADELQMAPGDLQVQVIQEEKELPCTMEREGQSNSTDFITCTIGTSSDAKITKVTIMYGGESNVLMSPKDYVWLLLLLIPIVIVEPTDSFTSRVGDVRGFAVAAPWVYVDTGDHLHQLDLSLVSLRSLHQRGTYVAVPESFDRTLAGLHAFGVKIMAPIVDRNVLITCGAIVCGYCELLDLRNITRIIHREFTEDASVGFLVDINNKSYLLTAAEISDTGVCPDKPTDPRIRLYGTNVGTPELFSFSDKTSSPEISARHRDVQFVNGFQIEKTIFIFSNVKVKTDLIKVRLIWLWAKEPKSKTLQSLRGATLDCSEGGEARQRLVSSSVIPGVQPVLWTGIFSEHGTTNTKLAIFDISPPPTNEQTYNDPDFSTPTVVNENREPSTLKPKRVLLKQRFMTSVVAVKLNKWLIVFVGTGDGQLLKLIVDNNLQAHCLTVIWKAVDEHPVFPEMHLDPVGRKHVLVAVKNQLTRVPVSQCGQHSSSLGTCWSAHDPYCGWCDSRKRCSFEDECPASLWLSVPDDLSQRRMLSHSFQEDEDGKIKLVVRTHLTTGESGPPANFSCRFVSSVGELEGLQHQYPQCTCLLPPVIGLRVNVIVSLEGVVVTEELKLVNCTGIIGAPTSLL